MKPNTFIVYPEDNVAIALEDILNTGRFMTMLCISIDVENKNLSWVRACHDPAIIYDPSLDQFEELKGDGLALGIDESKLPYRSNYIG